MVGKEEGLLGRARGAVSGIRRVRWSEEGYALSMRDSVGEL
jgi:hypothetical protein